jgi:1,4-dihydroxy-2-naphthoate octaprenyltransferase
VFADASRVFIGSVAAVLGAIILISIVLPWFLIGVVCIAAAYLYMTNFYRASAREVTVSSICIV